MKKIILILLFLAICPFIALAEWSTPVWTDDCTITVTKDKDGRVETWTETCYGQDGKQTSKQTDTYTYYEKGETNEIEQKVYDSKSALTSDKKVKHYLDSKQPTVSDVSIGEVER